MTELAQSERLGTQEGPTRKQVTSLDIENDPRKNQNNPVLEVDGESLRDIWLRNSGYGPGSFEAAQVPEKGSIRFLTKPTLNNEEGVHNWYIQGFGPDGKSVGVGFISTWNRRGAIITTKRGVRIAVFRPNLIVRR